ncbi:MAG TPA: polymer-forming cytoskeletal protein [Spirochaetota bacterium]|nr:polymer-forming cytoskeletal protein [Spirochaetota bacterium]HOL57985.1 polymer-forming cytoskeletal protein [Spirochaetota bacterium]HPP05328.1 polymer-forming cytoskeletal protein [Spirochaetota bacterium]
MSGILENYYNNKKIKTILGKDTNFNGNLSFKDSLKINGIFIGSINSSGVLVIGKGAIVQANVTAKTVIINGTIKGDVLAEEKVEMLPTGRVYGNIKAKKVKISDGVIFNGKCEIIR